MSNRYGIPELDDPNDKSANSSEMQAHNEWVRKQLEEICGPPMTPDQLLRNRLNPVKLEWTASDEEGARGSR